MSDILNVLNDNVVENKVEDSKIDDKNQDLANKNANNVENKEEFLQISLINQGVVAKQDKRDPLADIPDSEINYKNIELLNKFISDRGKIISSRITGVSVKKQRKLAKAIKRARNLALLSFISKLEEQGENL